MPNPAIKLLRFADLKAANVVTSWPQLKRLVENHGFPPGYLLSPAVRVWDAGAVDEWLEACRTASARLDDPQMWCLRDQMLSESRVSPGLNGEGAVPRQTRSLQRYAQPERHSNPVTATPVQLKSPTRGGTE